MIPPTYDSTLIPILVIAMLLQGFLMVWAMNDGFERNVKGERHPIMLKCVCILFCCPIFLGSAYLIALWFRM